jgi:hypothetical protein
VRTHPVGDVPRWSDLPAGDSLGPYDCPSDWILDEDFLRVKRGLSLHGAVQTDPGNHLKPC